MVMGYIIDNDLCVLCGACVPACPEGVVSETDCDYIIDFRHCTECDDCLPVCPTNAIVPAAEMTPGGSE